MNFELYWAVVVGIVFFLLFLPVEIMAAVDKQPGGTLSETVWKILYPNPKDKAYRFRRWIRIGFVMAFVWLFIHLGSGGWI